MGCTVSLVCCEALEPLPSCGPQPPGTPPGPARPERSEPGGAASIQRRRLLLQPEDLEAPKTHHFKVKAFKKVKPCGVCRQAITREGCICKVCSFSCHRKCQAKEVEPPGGVYSTQLARLSPNHSSYCSPASSSAWEAEFCIVAL